MRFHFAIGIVFSGVAMFATAPRAQEADILAVRRLLKQTYDKPEAPLALDAVVVEQDLAIADWSQGELAGRALLRRKDGAWSIALCAGDALKQSAALAKLGLKQPQAQALAAKLAEAERGLATMKLEKMSRFDDVVAVDAAGGKGLAQMRG